MSDQSNISELPVTAIYRSRKERQTGSAYTAIGAMLLCLSGVPALAAEGGRASTSSPAQVSSGPAAQAGSDGTAPLTLTLQDSLKRSLGYSPEFQAAATAAGVARQDIVQARAAMLPSADFLMQELLTQGDGKLPTGRYVTNDGVHVYRAWGVFRQTFSADTFSMAGYRLATAAEARALAEQEIARRGLAVTVTQAYYALVVAERQYGTAQEGLDQAGKSLKTSQELEQGGEVARSDVITFEIQYNQQKQALQQATLAMENARLALAVMLFPNFNQNFNVVDDLDVAPPLPPLEEATRMAAAGNPEIRSAMAALDVAKYGVSEARAAFLPALSFDADYGIEANAFALRSRVAAYPQAGRVPNLGFFITGSLSVPVWHWGATMSKLRQAEYQKKLAAVQLTFAQRQALKNLNAYYNEASTARSELSTLQSTVSLAAEGLRLNTLRYRAGDAAVLDVLNAENTLTQARDTYASGLARYRVALAVLQTLTGSF